MKAKLLMKCFFFVVDEVMPPKRPSDEVDFMEKMGKNSEEAINRFFRSLAESKILEPFEFVYYAIKRTRLQPMYFQWIACAASPWLILFPGLVFTTILCLGILKLEITTDPVELWAAPNSRSRVEKDYFDKTFAPFYRIEHLIITATDESMSVYKNSSDGEEKFGPIFNKTFMYAVMNLQREIEAVSTTCQKYLFLTLERST